MALTDKLQAEKAGLESYLDSERGVKLEQNQIERLYTLNSLLGISSSNANTTNQTAVQADAGDDATKAVAVQGITGGKAVSVVFPTAQAVTQSGAWSVGLATGSNVIGSISNTTFGISGLLPAFAVTPTFNIGTAPSLTLTNAFALESGGNLAAISGKLPSSLGAKTVANSLSTTIATDSPLQPPTTFAASTICLTTAVSELSIALNSVKKISIYSRTNTTFRISTTSGNTVNTQNFETIQTGNEYSESGLNFTGNYYFSAETLPTPITVAACSTTNGSPTVSSANSFSSIQLGQAVSGTGIPANTYVIRRAADGLSITLGDANGATVNATANATASTTLTFSGAVIRISRWT